MRGVDIDPRRSALVIDRAKLLLVMSHSAGLFPAFAAADEFRFVATLAQ
jgi:hypothetical protein